LRSNHKFNEVAKPAIMAWETVSTPPSQFLSNQHEQVLAVSLPVIEIIFY